MKRIALIVLLSYLIISGVAGQDLTIEKAVTHAGFYPNAPRLIWGGPAGGYLEVRNDELISTEVRKGKESVLFTRGDLNRVLEKSGLEPLRRLALPQVMPGGEFRFRSGQLFVDYDWKKGVVIRTIKLPERPANLTFSPDNQKMAFTRGANIFLYDENGQETMITNDTEDGILNGQTVSRNEFGISGGLFWSPEGNLLAFYRKDERQVPLYPIMDMSKVPAEPTPIRYPMAGGPSEYISLGIYDLKTGKTIFVEENAFDEERYLTNITWDPTGSHIYIAVLNREQNHMMLNRYDAQTGQKLLTLFEERSDQYVEPSRGPIFNPTNPEQFIWFSERDGFDHLYLYNTQGEMIRQLTSGEFVVTGFAGWDQKGRNIYIMSTEVSPLERHFYRVDVQTGSRTRLTPDAGNHSVQLSPDGKYLIDSYSNYSVSRRILLVDEKGKEVRQLFDAPNPLADVKLGEYKPLTIKAADRKTDLHGFMILPPDFDPSKKYPVVVYVYGGPHAQLVMNQWLGGASGWQYYMAQQGYIAFTLDNRGSDSRGRDFEQVIHRNLGQAEMADQLEGINYLFSLPYVDRERIGVHGWSFGGFMTVSLMVNHPDVFQVGVAGGPVIDWKYYEVMYGERYMDTPQENPDGFELSSTLNKVRNLRGRLMLIHGDIDPVVVMQNSLDFLRKAVSEGKLVDFMVYPRHEHNVGGRDRIHLMRTVTRYFEDHL